MVIFSNNLPTIRKGTCNEMVEDIEKNTEIDKKYKNKDILQIFIHV